MKQQSCGEGQPTPCPALLSTCRNRGALTRALLKGCPCLVWAIWGIKNSHRIVFLKKVCIHVEDLKNVPKNAKEKKKIIRCFLTNSLRFFSFL